MKVIKNKRRWCGFQGVVIVQKAEASLFEIVLKLWFGGVFGTDKIDLLDVILFLELIDQISIFLPLGFHHHLRDQVHLVHKDVYILR